jgi:hypothetical protein
MQIRAIVIVILRLSTLIVSRRAVANPSPTSRPIYQRGICDRRVDAAVLHAVAAQEDFADLAAGRVLAYRGAKFQPKASRSKVGRSSIW